MIHTDLEADMEVDHEQVNTLELEQMENIDYYGNTSQHALPLLLLSGQDQHSVGPRSVESDIA